MQLIYFLFIFLSKFVEPSIILPDPTVYLNKIFSPSDNEIIQAFPISSLVTYEEIRSGMKTLNQNSAPGLECFTANFFFFFLSPFAAKPLIIPSSANNSLLLNPFALIKLIPKTLNSKIVND